MQAILITAFLGFGLAYLLYKDHVADKSDD